MARIHIVGAGLAGLASALRLSKQGATVIMHEATQRAGGRCRSFHDETLDCVIDNGNHLLMGGNRAAMAYLEEIGARDRLTGPDESRYDFINAKSGERWSLQPNKGLIPWWVFAADRRVPGTSPLSLFPALKLLFSNDKKTVGDVIDDTTSLYRNMLEPLTVAAVNAPPQEAAASLMKPVLLETFGRGAEGCRPLIARNSLAEALIDPALEQLRERDVEIQFGHRLQDLDIPDGLVTGLDFGDKTLGIDPSDCVVIALPAWDAKSLLPELTVPPQGEPIVNVHFRNEGGPTDVGLIGVIDGFAHWIFTRPDIISITISAATEEAKLDAEEIARQCWADVCRALELDSNMPPYRVIKERRATVAQTPEAVAMRPDNRTQYSNLFLAGDWTDTGLPATIEAAIRSGNRAADLAMARS